MTSLTLFPDTPCTYPDTTTPAKKTGISNTPTTLAVFRNLTTIANLRAVLQRFDFIPANPSDDTIVTIQMVSVNNVVGGSWVDVVGSELDVNLTASSLTVIRPALTLYAQATQAHGNRPATGSLVESSTSNLGLELSKGNYFAIMASTDTISATVDLLWSVNWLERD
jgi:hypothetical protein